MRGGRQPRLGFAGYCSRVPLVEMLGVEAKPHAMPGLLRVLCVSLSLLRLVLPRLTCLESVLKYESQSFSWTPTNCRSRPDRLPSRLPPLNDLLHPKHCSLFPRRGARPQAPELVTSEMVAGMKAGSVTVDLAAANGGNIGTTVKDEVIVTDNGYETQRRQI